VLHQWLHVLRQLILQRRLAFPASNMKFESSEDSGLALVLDRVVLLFVVSGGLLRLVHDERR